MSTIDIHPLYSMAEMQQAVALQQTYWGTHIESVIPAHMLFSLANYGGHVLGAWDADTLVGVLVGFIGTDIEDARSNRPAMANLRLVSKRMVVLPAFRGQGIGYRLKLAQRDIANRQGIRLITWTFDPLIAMNAHLNLRKLAGVCQTFQHDYYGEGTDSGLAMLGSTDRFFVDWWVTHRRVEERLHGQRGNLTLQQYLEAGSPIVNPTQMNSDGAKPATETTEPSGAFALLEIPLDYPAMTERDPDLAHQWRQQTRTLIELLLAQGYIVTDFIKERHEGRERAFYLFSFNMGFDFSLN